MKRLFIISFYFIFLFFGNSSFAQNIRYKPSMSVSAGLNYSGGIIQQSFVHVGGLNFGWNILFPLNNSWAFETGIVYNLALVTGYSHSQDMFENGTMVGTIGNDDPHLYHFGRIPLMLSKKIGRRSSDRLFFGINGLLPIYQPIILEMGGFILEGDIFIPSLTAEIGYRFLLEEKSYFSVGMAFNFTRVSPFDLVNSTQDAFLDYISGRLIHFHFTYHYFFENK